MVSGYMVIFVFASRQIKLLLACSSSKIFEDSLRLDIFTLNFLGLSADSFAYFKYSILLLVFPCFCIAALSYVGI